MSAGSNAPERLDAAMPAIREAVISTLPAANAEWLVRMRGGQFDSGPLMVAAIAAWAVGAGVE
ncbi:hypothetical protein KC8_17465 [Sphingomonas sp. KC8]|nr:hypothetical protein KC8_17465 [Sphingomonas sp. KC8]